ncbi:MAG: sigma-70 family RNA polymerase sigma factor [Patescibacteria group bacterium]
MVATSQKAVLEEETDQLFQDYLRNRSLKIRNKIVDLHESLVRYLAGRFAKKGEPTEDLVQIGSIGLIKAVERYDPSFGTKFSTYATPTIVGEIKRYFRDKTWKVKIPRGLQELALTVNNLIKESGGNFNLSKLAFKVDASEEDVCEAIRITQFIHMASLDIPLGSQTGDNSLPLKEFLDSGDRFADDLIEHNDLESALDCLEPREKDVIYGRFFKEETQTRVAENLGISQMHVSRLQAKTLLRLKELLADCDIQIKAKKIISESKESDVRLCEPLELSENMVRIFYTTWQYLKLNKGFSATKIAKEVGLDNGKVFLGTRRLVEIGGLSVNKGVRSILNENFIVRHDTSECIKVAPNLYISRNKVYDVNELETVAFREIPVKTDESEGKCMGRRKRKGVIPLTPLRALVAIVAGSQLSFEEYRDIDYDAIQSASGLGRKQIYQVMPRLDEIFSKPDSEWRRIRKPGVSFELVQGRHTASPLLKEIVKVEIGKTYNLDELIASFREIQERKTTPSEDVESMPLSGLDSSVISKKRRRSRF